MQIHDAVKWRQYHNYQWLYLCYSLLNRYHQRPSLSVVWFWVCVDEQREANPGVIAWQPLRVSKAWGWTPRGYVFRFLTLSTMSLPRWFSHPGYCLAIPSKPILSSTFLFPISISHLSTLSLLHPNFLSKGVNVLSHSYATARTR